MWVERVGATVTFAEVIALANDLYTFCKENLEEPEQSFPQKSPNASGSSEEYSPSGSQSDQSPDETKNEDANSEDSKDSKDSEDQKEFEEDDFDLGSYGGTDSTVDISETQQSLVQAQEILVDDSAREWVYLTTPTIDLDDHLIHWKVINQDLSETFPAVYSSSNENERGVSMSFSKFDQYKKTAQKSVNYLVKQFEMRKSADQYSRAGISKTGVINTNKLHN